MLLRQAADRVPLWITAQIKSSAVALIGKTGQTEHPIPEDTEQRCPG